MTVRHHVAQPSKPVSFGGQHPVAGPPVVDRPAVARGRILKGILRDRPPTTVVVVVVEAFPVPNIPPEEKGKEEEELPSLIEQRAQQELQGNSLKSQPRWKYMCPECQGKFLCWGPCLEHLKETGHANVRVTRKGLQQRCMISERQPPAKKFNHPHSFQAPISADARKVDPDTPAKYMCPNCLMRFPKWTPCRVHLVATGHANVRSYTKGIQQRCMVTGQCPVNRIDDVEVPSRAVAAESVSSVPGFRPPEEPSAAKQEY